MPGDREADPPRADRSACRVHTADARVITHEARHLAVLHDVDAEPVRGTGIGPYDGVVARDSGAPLLHAADNGQATLGRYIEDRNEVANLPYGEQLRVDPVELHTVDPVAEALELMTAVRQAHEAALAEHDVEVQIAAQLFVESQRKLVDARALREEVIGADDRRVTTRIAAADPAFFENGDPRDPVVASQVVGSREAVPAATDDEDVVLRPGIRRPPGRALGHARRDRPAKQRERGVFLHARAAPPVTSLPRRPQLPPRRRCPARQGVMREWAHS